MLGKLPHAPFLNNEMMRIKIVFLNNCRVHRMAFVSAIFGVFGLILLSILLRFVMLNRSSKHDLSFFTITYKPLSRLRLGERHSIWVSLYELCCQFVAPSIGYVHNRFWMTLSFVVRRPRPNTISW